MEFLKKLSDLKKTGAGVETPNTPPRAEAASEIPVEAAKLPETDSLVVERHPLLKLQDVDSDHSGVPPYHDHVTVILTNNWDTEIEVWGPVWESEEVHTPLPIDPCLQLEDPNGWREFGWESNPQSALIVPSCKTFRVSLDLMTASNEGVRMRIEHGTTGRLVFPIKLGGKLRYDAVQI